MVAGDIKTEGLNEEQVSEARKRYGYNRILLKKENKLLHIAKSLLGEPMLILLLVAVKDVQEPR